MTVYGDTRKGLNALIILGAWTIWKLRNDCVFNGAAPSIPMALARAREEAHLWSLAGARDCPYTQPVVLCLSGWCGQVFLEKHR